MKVQCAREGCENEWEQGPEVIGRPRKYCSPRCRRLKNHAAEMERDRERLKHGCRECGGPIARQNDSGLCHTCTQKARRARREARWDQIEEMWGEGLTIEKIGERLGLTRGHTAVEVVRAREAGRNLPYRTEGGEKHPELAS